MCFFLPAFLKLRRKAQVAKLNPLCKNKIQSSQRKRTIPPSTLFCCYCWSLSSFLTIARKGMAMGEDPLALAPHQVKLPMAEVYTQHLVQGICPQVCHDKSWSSPASKKVIPFGFLGPNRDLHYLVLFMLAFDELTLTYDFSDCFSIEYILVKVME